MGFSIQNRYKVGEAFKYVCEIGNTIRPCPNVRIELEFDD